jgi:hypothetical protein
MISNAARRTETLLTYLFQRKKPNVSGGAYKRVLSSATQISKSRLRALWELMSVTTNPGGRVSVLVDLKGTDPFNLFSNSYQDGFVSRLLLCSFCMPANYYSVKPKYTCAHRKARGFRDAEANRVRHEYLSNGSLLASIFKLTVLANIWFQRGVNLNLIDSRILLLDVRSEKPIR